MVKFYGHFCHNFKERDGTLSSKPAVPAGWSGGRGPQAREAVKDPWLSLKVSQLWVCCFLKQHLAPSNRNINHLFFTPRDESENAL